jgi:hypothetical protein
MSTGRKIPLKGVRLDRSGTRIVPDLKQLDASKQAKAKGGPTVKLGRSKSSTALLKVIVKKRAPLMKRLAKR